MKSKIKCYYLGNTTGTKKNGEEWNALKVQDSDLSQFMIFGNKAKDYLGTNVGEELELEVNITKRKNFKTNQDEISINF